MNAKQAEALVRVLDLVIAALAVAPELRARMHAANGKVREMIAEDRDPSPEEWAADTADHAALTERLRQALAAKRQPFAELPETED